MKIAKLAEEATGFFEIKTRTDEKRIFVLKGYAPQWIRDLIREAHKYGTNENDCFMPDDGRYEFIYNALCVISSNPDDPFSEIESSIYNYELVNWLGSNLLRSSYVDEARENGFVSNDTNIMDQISWGQYQERNEVLSSVLSFLDNTDSDVCFDVA